MKLTSTESFFSQDKISQKRIYTHTYARKLKTNVPMPLRLLHRILLGDMKIWTHLIIIANSSFFVSNIYTNLLILPLCTSSLVSATNKTCYCNWYRDVEWWFDISLFMEVTAHTHVIYHRMLVCKLCQTKPSTLCTEPHNINGRRWVMKW